ncbi:MAG: TonB-dependent receptor plug domain-containing protein [Gammaproteobacteria bacterium]
MKPATIAIPAFIITAQFLLTAGVAPPLLAQEAGVEEEVVVTGSRREARSVYDSTTPIDVIGAEDFRNQGTGNMTELLRTVVPSFNVNTQPVGDASTVVRPVNLRGLPPDHTLVLVNGKRRHRAAVIGWLTNGVSDGAQGPDVAVIPAIALKQVEVLRDGAAAQYGSDAIAGVMNFILKDAAEGGSLEAKYGQYGEGGEQEYQVSGNIGLPLGTDGFFNASFEYGQTDETFRAVQRTDAQALIDAGNTDVANAPDPAQNWGNPEFDIDIKTFFNLGVALSDTADVYAFGNFARREGEGSFYYRHPNTRGAVFTSDGGVTRLIGDLDGVGEGGTCPSSVPVSDDASIPMSISSNENCFVFNTLFPGGFTPRFTTRATDYSLVAGTRGDMGGVNYDLSAGFGKSDAEFSIFNTINASLGPDSPTEFDSLGDYTQTEYNFSADFSYPVQMDMFASDLNVAAGFEYRIEEFKITAGQRESWIDGDLAAQGFSVGANGFPGFPDSIAGEWDRSNYAFYLDLETDVTDRWLLAAAIRYEDFDTFGSTFNGKVASHFRLTDSLGLRGAFSTGFRAPTPGQQNASNTTSAFDSEAMDIILRGTIPSNSALAMQRGGTTLAEEKSVNFTGGLVFQWQDFGMSIDYYNIKVSDRIALTQNFTLDDDERTMLIAAGVPMAGDLQTFRFFQNAFDTRNQGVDVVGSYSMDMGAGTTDLAIAWNYNKAKVKDRKTEVINAQRVREVQDGLPKSRFNFTATHHLADWRLMLRFNYVSGWYDEEDDANTGPANVGDPDPFDGYYDGYYTLDTELAWRFRENLTLVFGGQNFTDEKPDEHPFATTTLGNRYSQFAPLGFNGAFYYGRIRYEF